MMQSNTKLLVSPDGKTAARVHALDLETGHYPQYEGWIDTTNYNDEEFAHLLQILQASDKLRERWDL